MTTEIINHSYKSEPKVDIVSGTVCVTVRKNWFFSQRLTEDDFESVTQIGVPDDHVENTSNTMAIIGIFLCFTGIGIPIGLILISLSYATFCGNEVRKESMKAFVIKVQNYNYLKLMTEDIYLIERLKHLMKFKRNI